MPLRIPTATYRLQFNSNFTFADAEKVIPYLQALGITDVYASPYFTAQPGSSHGYDVIDHNSLNPEVGTPEDHQRMCEALIERGMGHIIDIVPNHMSIIGRGNAWWADVLENGRSSPYARFFDIDWSPLKDELEDKIILPILSGQYGYVLEDGELQLVFEDAAFFVSYYEHRLPLDPSSYPIVLTHAIEEFQEAVGPDSQAHSELLSIITALNNLPGRLERDAGRIDERMREKDVAKKRIQALYDESPEFRDFLDANIMLFNGEKGRRESFDLLDGLLSAQVYRPAFWRVATEEINYRRFFDINDLGAIKVEDPVVFSETHRLVFDLVERGLVTGIRVDHPDGLHNPASYFRMLQEGCFTARCKSEADARKNGDACRQEYRRVLAEKPDSSLRRPFYVVGEKILMENEGLSESWPVFGTTGYGFLNSVNGVFVDAENSKELDKIFISFTRESRKFSELFYLKKKLIMETTMAGEINVLGHELNRISEGDRHYRDLTLNNLTDAIVEVIAFFPVYRTYISPAGISDVDRKFIETAIHKAKRLSRRINPLVYQFIHDVLLLEHPRDGGGKATRKQCLDFTMKFQQLTGPVMAKGVEDTVFYTYNRLVSLNEVGGNPDRVGTSAEAFHGQNIERRKKWPHTLIATSTHDTKRSEDVRARINVLSELSTQWRQQVQTWSRINRRYKSRIEGELTPDRNEEYLLYQTLVGAWPHGGFSDDGGRAEFIGRIKQYVLKAAREAKKNTSWLNPDGEYEESLATFIDGVLGSAQFVGAFEPFARQVSHYGILNSLSQTLLKLTSPGVPDMYQGTELWNLRLVDPDNRVPVDYESRMKLLNDIKDRGLSSDRRKLAIELAESCEDGRVKMYLTYKTLNYRKERAGLFAKGRYIPLEISGEHARCVVAFARMLNEQVALTIVPRFTASIVKSKELPVGDVWRDTAVLLPDELSGKKYFNVLTGEDVGTSGGGETSCVAVSAALGVFPVALLESAS